MLRGAIGMKKLYKNDAEAFLTRKEEIVRDDFIQVRFTEFGIVGTPRIAGGDEMESIQSQACRLFKWYEDEEERKKYTAPCMPLVQSSGTGKRKLFYDFGHLKDPKLDYQRIFISCLKKDTRRDFSSGQAYDVIK